MITIDCANDAELAEELRNYMRSKGMDARTEGGQVLSGERDVEGTLRSFLDDSKKSGYTIRRIDESNILLAREVPIEEFGFLRCEMCGYVVSNEGELITHRRAHGIELL